MTSAPAHLISELLVDALANKDDALAVQAVPQVHPLPAILPRRAVRHPRNPDRHHRHDALRRSPGRPARAEERTGRSGFAERSMPSEGQPATPGTALGPEPHVARASGESPAMHWSLSFHTARDVNSVLPAVHCMLRATHPALAVVLRTTSPKQAPLPFWKHSATGGKTNGALSARPFLAVVPSLRLLRMNGHRACPFMHATNLARRGGLRTSLPKESSASVAHWQPCTEQATRLSSKKSAF